MKDSYFTVDRPAAHEIKIKGSRFIGSVHPVHNTGQIHSFLEQVAKSFVHASHHCYAYRLGLNSDSFRYSDDGEPSGTAGKPIFEALRGRELTNTLCIVTRYFGGTKLGTGGLIRAYGRCAAETLDMSGKVLQHLHKHIRLTFTYALTGAVMSVVSQSDSDIVDTEYGELTHLTLKVRVSLAEDLIRQLIDVSAGQIEIEVVSDNGC